MSGSLFYDLGRLDQIAVNLFYGWGYNFYRHENQLRADDLIVRERIGWLLGRSRALVEAAESSYRRKHLPSPSRAKPLPDADAVEAARSLEALSSGIGQLEAAIRSLPVPENDRMTQRYRQEADTLSLLVKCDQQLAGLAEALRQVLEDQDHEWLLANLAAIRDGMALIDNRVRERAALLK